MSLPELRKKLTVLLGALLIVSGVALWLWALDHLPGRTGLATARGNQATLANAQPATPATTVPWEQVVVAMLPGVPDAVQQVSQRLATERGFRLTTSPEPGAAVRIDLTPAAGDLLYTQTFAAATRFDRIDPQLAWTVLQAAWQGQTAAFTAVAVLSDTLPALHHLLGAPGPTVYGYANDSEVTEAVWSGQATLALLPFDQLTPRLVVLAVAGQNPVENSQHFDPTAYPLAVHTYLHRANPQAPGVQAVAADLLQRTPPGNRDPARLTVIAMTGVTALCRMTAQQMDREGNDWPAQVVGPELATADITHISNEVPFVPGCKTDVRAGNLTFCSKPEYLATLQASGVDIVGLTGNHQNDYGREDALQSLAIYAEAGIPLYGGGRNQTEAEAPLYLEHNGNRLAFLGANSYGPEFAWATADLPGSARFALKSMSTTIQAIKAAGKADVVLAELQYQESYNVTPLIDQRNDFRALARAGADIVTGVQSHVPQALEFEGGRLILYGLGNLYFDQMYNQATREGMIVKHTIYAGRHLSTQILTTLLYDFGQPRWATAIERQQLLQRVFGASFWE